MHWQLRAMACFGGLCLFTVGCNPPESDPGEDVDTARQTQLDPGQLGWRKYTITLNTDPTATLFEVHAMYSTAGSYAAGKEYWNVNKDALANIGAATLSISYSDYSSGTPSPTSFTHQQTFDEAIDLTWTAITGDDPISGSTLYNSGSTYFRVNKDGSSPPAVTRVTWYQVIDSSSSPANLGPSGTFSTTGSVSWDTGETAYYITYEP